MITDSFFDRPESQSTAEIKEYNNAFLDKLVGNDSMQFKTAADAQSMVTRLRLREKSYLHKIIPPETISNDMLQRALEFQDPCVIIDLECDVPGSITIPFNHNGSPTVMMQNSRYPVYINRLVSPTMYKDVGELRTATLDIRQIVMDAIVKDLSAYIDKRFMAVNDIALGGIDQEIPVAHNVLFKSIAGTLGRDTLVDFLNIMPKSGVNYGLVCSTILVNQVTIMEFMKMGREETGGNKAEEVFMNGLSEISYAGKTWIVTIKRDLIPDGRMYGYTSPEFIGKNYVLTDTTVTVKQDQWFLHFSAAMEQGASIGNICGLCAAQFENY